MVGCEGSVAPNRAKCFEPIAAFLDMVSAERGAAANTLEAYRRDLTDYRDFLAARGGSVCGRR